MTVSDKYSVARVEIACEKALTYTPHPSYKTIKTILQTGQDKLEKEDAFVNNNDEDKSFGFIRGAEYYGRQS